MNTRHERRIPHFGIDAILTVLFFLLALSSIISYFVWLDEYPRLFIYLGVAAAVVRVLSYLIRAFTNKK